MHNVSLRIMVVLWFSLITVLECAEDSGDTSALAKMFKDDRWLSSYEAAVRSAGISQWRKLRQSEGYLKVVDSLLEKTSALKTGRNWMPYVYFELIEFGDVGESHYIAAITKGEDFVEIFWAHPYRAEGIHSIRHELDSKSGRIAVRFYETAVAKLGSEIRTLITAQVDDDLSSRGVYLRIFDSSSESRKFGCVIGGASGTGKDFAAKLVGILRGQGSE